MYVGYIKREIIFLLSLSLIIIIIILIAVFVIESNRVIVFQKKIMMKYPLLTDIPLCKMSGSKGTT